MKKEVPSEVGTRNIEASKRTVEEGPITRAMKDPKWEEYSREAKEHVEEVAGAYKEGYDAGYAQGHSDAIEQVLRGKQTFRGGADATPPKVKDIAKEIIETYKETFTALKDK